MKVIYCKHGLLDVLCEECELGQVSCWHWWGGTINEDGLKFQQCRKCGFYREMLAGKNYYEAKEEPRNEA